MLAAAVRNLRKAHMRRSNRHQAPHLEWFFAHFDQASGQQPTLAGTDDVDLSAIVLLKVCASITNLFIHRTEDVGFIALYFGL